MRIGLLLHSIYEDYQRSVMQGVREAAEQSEVELVCLHGIDFRYLEDIPALLSGFAELFALDGILILSAVISDNLNGARISSVDVNVPMVAIGSQYADFPSVTVDTAEATRKLFEHLSAVHGYRRFLYIGGPRTNHDSNSREQVLRKSVTRAAEHDASFSLQAINGSFFCERLGMNVIRDYIQLHPERDIDAVLAGSDTTAIGVIKYLETCQEPSWKSCPVTGFDDIPAAGFCNPPLTTVRQPMRELGLTALDLICSIIQGNSPDNRNIQASLILRESCSCLPAASGISEKSNISEFEKRMSRDIVQFGQSLINIRHIHDLIEPLDTLLISLSVKQFYLFGYTEPVCIFPAMAQLLYHNSIPVEEHYNQYPRSVKFVQELEKVISSVCDVNNPLYVYLLASGTENLGMVLYSGNDASLPFLSNCGLFLNNALLQLKNLAEEKAYSESLEREVKIRTRELQKEAERRLAVEAEVLRISDLERMRFSMDLHDDICQRLAGIAMLCRNYRKQNSIMETLSRMASDTLRQTRSYAYSSFPMEVQTLGLQTALHSLCEELSSSSSFSCSCRIPADFPSDLKEDQQINLFRIAREALHNAVRHSGGSSAEVSFNLDDGFLVMQVRDNGKGSKAIMSSAVINTAQRRPRGIGLCSMEYRAHQLHANYTITSSEEDGTCIEVRIALARQGNNSGA